MFSTIFRKLQSNPKTELTFNAEQLACRKVLNFPGKIVTLRDMLRVGTPKIPAARAMEIFKLLEDKRLGVIRKLGKTYQFEKCDTENMNPSIVEELKMLSIQADEFSFNTSFSSK
ncbi:hypothetical protein O9G_006331 [Rozella allomycis CSF55]|uniref:Uncharacterized protein n=1 Tax=Rozella allomycis (strain CSF55) TaxID=988480 RepID=A0A075B542_ROZAC|nr:hypothetical protein O9G_006331 [Rozella allomycis CSF55]|eukprot:EPZ36893.1 hypothetical protein O9G_006331 [Rozella allomycis CSF55]